MRWEWQEKHGEVEEIMMNHVILRISPKASFRV